MMEDRINRKPRRRTESTESHGGGQNQQEATGEDRIRKHKNIVQNRSKRKATLEKDSAQGGIKIKYD